MTLLAKFLAVLIGLAIGLVGRTAARRHTTVSGLVIVSVAVTAALVGGVAADLTGSTGFGIVALPALFSGVAVGVLIMTMRPQQRD